MACQLDKKIENTPKIGNEKKVYRISDERIDTAVIYLYDNISYEVAWDSVESGTKIEAALQLINDSDKPIWVKGVMTYSGGCYVYLGQEHFTKGKQELVKPNQALTLRLVQDTRYKNGRIAKTLRIFWADENWENHLEKRFRFEGWVERN